MFKPIVTILLVLSATSSFGAEKPQTEEQKTLYAVGLSVARQLSVFNLTPGELELVEQGIRDGVAGKAPAVELGAYTGQVQELARARRKIAAAKLQGVNREFLDQAAARKGAVKSASGLVYISVKEGTGVNPGPKDTVLVNYRGSLPDGREFDSSYKRGKPAELRMDGVIKCWTEGLQKMKAGGKAQLVCPASLAYGEAGAGDLILPGATLNFEVELVEIKR